MDLHTSKKQMRTIIAAREGSHVRRCHTIPHHGEYTVGKHSYDAVNLLLFLYPGEPSINLIKAILWHDLGERWAGDAPYPATLKDEGFAEGYRRVEELGRQEHGIHIPQLTAFEAQWLSAVDKIELYLWAQEQLALGNRMVEEYLEVLWNWFNEKHEQGVLPKEAWNFVQQYVFERLKDVEERKNG